MGTAVLFGGLNDLSQYNEAICPERFIQFPSNYGQVVVLLLHNYAKLSF